MDCLTKNSINLTNDVYFSFLLNKNNLTLIEKSSSPRKTEEKLK